MCNRVHRRKDGTKDPEVTKATTVPGCQYLMAQQYVRLDWSYLDERRPLEKDIEEEHPYVIQRSEDHIDSEHLGGFVGQACFYFVREIKAAIRNFCAEEYF